MADVIDNTLGITLRFTTNAEQNAKEIRRYGNAVLKVTGDVNAARKHIQAFFTALVAGGKINGALLNDVSELIKRITNLKDSAIPGADAMRGLSSAVLQTSVAFFGLFKAGDAIVGFSTRVASLNRQMHLLAVSSGMSVRELMTFGGVAKGFGGSVNDEASIRRSMMLESARRRVGLGVGGQFLEVAKRFNVRYIPNDPTAQMREYARFLSSGVSEDRKRLFAQMVGLSTGQYRAMSQGLGRYDQYVREFSRYNRHAAKSGLTAEEFSLQMEGLSQAWQQLKSVALDPVIKALTQVVKLFKELFAFLGKFPVLTKLIGVITALATVVVGAGTALSVFVFSIKRLRDAFSAISPNVNLMIGQLHRLGVASRRVAVANAGNSLLGRTFGRAGASVAAAGMTASVFGRGLLGRVLPKVALKGASRFVPFVGGAVAGAMAVDDFRSGRTVAGVGNSIAALANLIPGVGTWIGAAIGIGGEIIQSMIPAKNSIEEAAEAVRENTEELERARKGSEKTFDWMDVLNARDVRNVVRQSYGSGILVQNMTVENHSVAQNGKEMVDQMRQALLGELGTYTQNDRTGMVE